MSCVEKRGLGMRTVQHAVFKDQVYKFARTIPGVVYAQNLHG